MVTLYFVWILHGPLFDVDFFIERLSRTFSTPTERVYPPVVSLYPVDQVPTLFGFTRLYKMPETVLLFEDSATQLLAPVNLLIIELAYQGYNDTDLLHVLERYKLRPIGALVDERLLQVRTATTDGAALLALARQLEGDADLELAHKRIILHASPFTLPNYLLQYSNACKLLVHEGQGINISETPFVEQYGRIRSLTQIYLGMHQNITDSHRALLCSVGSNHLYTDPYPVAVVRQPIDGTLQRLVIAYLATGGDLYFNDAGMNNRTMGTIAFPSADMRSIIPINTRLAPAIHVPLE